MIEIFIRRLPVTLGIMIISFAFVLWMIAISLNQVHPFFPFISDLGITQPGSSMFTFCLGFASLLLLIFVICRYRLTRYHLKNYNAEISWANYSLATGLIMVVAMCTTGSIPNDEPKYIQILHNIFAALLFTAVQFDILIELFISRHLPNQARVSKLRLGILIISLTFVTLFLTTMVISFQHFPQSFLDKSLRLWWSSDDPGYIWHVISAILEWLVIIMLGPHVMSYRSLFQTDINLNEKKKCTNYYNNDGNYIG
uniref:DNA damage-regulated autophagy modulator protein 1-like n=1 Tax=Dermatophagoides pteronyssinus TaxID=6956 RepID=A0A6P6Y1M5_DERPT|nr:DNA damage-regulated autophagy modulator protein 1-like [Dermatophagoides pteronyssinus]